MPHAAGRPNGAPMDNREQLERAAARRRKQQALAQRLRSLRAYRGYTQQQLADRARVPRQVISGLEQAKRPRPEAITLERLALALMVSVDQLRGKAPVPELGQEPAPAPPREPVAPGPPAPGVAEGVPAEVPLAAEYLTALGFLPALPPGTTITYKRDPDGTVTIFLRVPERRGGGGGGGNPAATDAEYDDVGWTT